MSWKVDIEGLTPDEILAVPDEEMDAFVFCGEPISFTAGTAEVLGEFRREGDTLVLELAHIDGGGEGVLPTIALLARRYARTRGFTKVEWIVHAVTCANPNEKLRALLVRRGFELDGDVYRAVEQLARQGGGGTTSSQL